MTLLALFEENPNPSMDEVKHFMAGNLCRCSGYEGQHRGIEKYLEVRRHGVNESVKKIDGMGLMLGKPAYTGDLIPENALVVKILRSPHGHARIISIDASKAKAMAEIKLVLTYKDLSDHTFSRAGQGFPEPSPYDKKFFLQG